MKSVLVSILASLALLVGCNANDEAEYNNENMENFTQPINYETKGEAEQRFDNSKGQVQKNEASSESDTLPEDLDSNELGFYSEESEAISNRVNQMEEIRKTQAYVTDSKVVVAVIVNQEYDQNVKAVSQDIYRQVEQMIPDKEVVVYTDDIYWNRLRNLNARPNASNK